MLPSINPLTSSSEFHYMSNSLTSEILFSPSRNFESSRRMARQLAVQSVMKIGSELTEESVKFVHPG